MVKLLYLVTTLILMSSCLSYFLNECGIEEPKYPKYSLKDKKGFILPESLDTINIYRYYGYYDINQKLIQDESIRNWYIYYKFYSNGRVFGFGTEKLKQENLNPKCGSKGYYYYDKTKNIIKIETYITVEWAGYTILNYKLGLNGNTLTSYERDKKSKIYIREEIPKQWKKYKPNW